MAYANYEVTIPNFTQTLIDSFTKDQYQISDEGITLGSNLVESLQVGNPCYQPVIIINGIIKVEMAIEEDSNYYQTLYYIVTYDDKIISQGYYVAQYVYKTFKFIGLAFGTDQNSPNYAVLRLLISNYESYDRIEAVGNIISEGSFDSALLKSVITNNYEAITTNGGGATHIALEDGLLSELGAIPARQTELYPYDLSKILIVSGGGGGGSFTGVSPHGSLQNAGMIGGGVAGQQVTNYLLSGDQNYSHGVCYWEVGYKFGQGQNGDKLRSGGGGGYYGGYNGQYIFNQGYYD